MFRYLNIFFFFWPPSLRQRGAHPSGNRQSPWQRGPRQRPTRLRQCGLGWRPSPGSHLRGQQHRAEDQGWCPSVDVFGTLNKSLLTWQFLPQSSESSDLSDGPITVQEFMEVKSALTASEAKIQQLLKVNCHLSEELRLMQSKVRAFSLHAFIFAGNTI